MPKFTSARSGIDANPCASPMRPLGRAIHNISITPRPLLLRELRSESLPPSFIQRTSTEGLPNGTPEFQEWVPGGVGGWRRSPCLAFGLLASRPVTLRRGLEDDDQQFSRCL